MTDRETKYRIMDTAMELIWQSTYESVGVSEICEKAKVNKGSFYHFFPSKEVLAVEALNNAQKKFQPLFDQIFSSEKKPIRRLMDFCDFVLQAQAEKKKKVGYVCGCPYTNIGLEQSSQSKMISDNTQKCLNNIKKYFISAVQDAIDSKEINIKDVHKKANELFTYYLGSLIEARITNDLKPLSELKRVFKELLGAKKISETVC